MEVIQRGAPVKKLKSFPKIFRFSLVNVSIFSIIAKFAKNSHLQYHQKILGINAKFHVNFSIKVKNFYQWENWEKTMNTVKPRFTAHFGVKGAVNRSERYIGVSMITLSFFLRSMNLLLCECLIEKMNVSVLIYNIDQVLVVVLTSPFFLLDMARLGWRVFNK